MPASPQFQGWTLIDHGRRMLKTLGVGSGPFKEKIWAYWGPRTSSRRRCVKSKWSCGNNRTGNGLGLGKHGAQSQGPGCIRLEIVLTTNLVTLKQWRRGKDFGTTEAWTHSYSYFLSHLTSLSNRFLQGKSETELLTCELVNKVIVKNLCHIGGFQ